MTTNHVSKEEMIVPRTESVRKSSTQDVRAMTPADTATTSGADMALPPGAPDTATTRGLWAALPAHVTATAAELASTAGVSRSTANKILAALEEAGWGPELLAVRRAPSASPTCGKQSFSRSPRCQSQPRCPTRRRRQHVKAPVSDQREDAHRDKAVEPHKAMAADLPNGDSDAPPGTGSHKARRGASARGRRSANPNR